jgi:glycerol-3-phosphate dehydrogenase
VEPTPPQNQVHRTAFDLIIIGAGINGAGIARDAALRGLRVLLLDKGDAGGGTSSASTRLIHGGLRYLEHGEFGLVFESLREREILLRIAPHLIKPLPILIPAYKGAGRGPWTIRAGMIAYDLLARLSGKRSVPRHRLLSRTAALAHAPGLNPKGLRSAALYYDAQVEFPERLVFENALAACEAGATLNTYARVDKLIVEGQTVHGVEYTDLLGNQQHTAQAPLTINAAGPWVDELAGAVGAERLIGGTKGSHLVVAPFTGSPRTALYVEAQLDRRPFFIIPWNGNYLIGTTDIRYEGDPGSVQIEAQEIDYLLAETNRVIPAANLTRASILFMYSGVRPLAYAKDQSEQSITRRHFIRDHSPKLAGFVSIVGGKLTTYRSLAEEAVNLAFKKLGRTAQPCSTHEVSLPGASIETDLSTLDFQKFRKQFKEGSGLAKHVSERLLRIYGTRAQAVLHLAAQGRGLEATFSATTGALAAEVVYSFQSEFARTLADCLLRRTMIGLSATVGIGDDHAAAQIAREHLGWSAERAQHEISNYRQFVERFRSASLDSNQPGWP